MKMERLQEDFLGNASKANYTGARISVDSVCPALCAVFVMAYLKSFGGEFLR